MKTIFKRFPMRPLKLETQIGIEWRLNDFSTSLFKQLAQHRAMAVRFILAIAADREICMMGQFGKQLKGITHFGQFLSPSDSSALPDISLL